jgi:hypothetical protein
MSNLKSDLKSTYLAGDVVNVECGRGFIYRPTKTKAVAAQCRYQW